MGSRLVYILRLTPLPGDSRPPVVRLRQLLKATLRACGLRCLTVVEEKPSGKVEEGKVKQAP